ncbi:YkvA family protein [Chishuiella sp.]|uniref:YkvA family protein n=1 Tax=Chishuiella sp. TaxID=1969467 RepID=UPI0028A71442|nr:DUF1232 domain-containing protein [Chishuiella sp.]
MKKTRLLKVIGAAGIKAQKDKSFFEKVKTFFALLNDYRKGLYKPKVKNLAIAFFVLAYLISPLDIIPEAIFGPFGLIDDFGIFMIGMKFLNKEIVRYSSWKMTELQSI